jgi:hypothetical protein
MREPEGRQDRFRGGLVKGVRFSDPGCLPSSGASRLPPVPKHERTAELSSRYGVHVMRIAVPRTNRLPFASCGPRAFASGSQRCSRWVVPPVARPPSTRLLPRTSFRPVRCRGRASLSPKTTYRLLQYDDVRAPTAGRRVLDRGEGRRAPHLRSLFAFSCESTRATSHETRAHPKVRVFRGPAGPSEGPRAFRRRESPPRNRPRTPLSCVRAREEDGSPFRISRAHRADVPRERDAPTAEVLCSAAPREGRSGRRRPRCVPPLCAPIVSRGLLLASRLGRALCHAAPVWPRGAPTLCSKSACAFWTTSRCPA